MNDLSSGCAKLTLVAAIDWYSRYVAAWELDSTLEIDFVLSLLCHNR